MAGCSLAVTKAGAVEVAVPRYCFLGIFLPSRLCFITSLGHLLPMSEFLV